MNTKAAIARTQAPGNDPEEMGERLVEERAKELARMDGRLETNDSDWIQAREELSTQFAKEPPPPETVALEHGEMITAWDEAPADAGTAAAKVVPEDEANIAEALVREGLEEAEHDQRLSASDDLTDDSAEDFQ